MRSDIRQKSNFRGFSLVLVIAAVVSCNESNNFRSESLTTGQSGESFAQSDDATAKSGASNQPSPEGSADAIAASIETTVIDVSRKPDTIINSFAASAIKDASFKFSLTPKAVNTEFVLEDILAQRKDSFAQLTRSPVTELFKQGNPGQPVNEIFDQNARKGLVDILVVIDNSGSMSQEQVNLSSKMNELLTSIKDSNWQLSVITTSPTVPAGVNQTLANSEGKELCNTTLIKANEADASTKFAAAINAGLAGNGNEQGIRQAVVGLRCTEKPWIRPTSTLAVLIVSDEDNCSLDGSNCGTLPWAKESYLTNYVENTLNRVIGKNAGFFGIVGPSKALCPTEGNPATQYLRLFSYKANGATNYGNICDASYKTTLNRISDSIALLLDNQFELKSLPDTASLKLSIMQADGSIQNADPISYMQNARVITFMPGSEPAAGAKVIADYKIGAQLMSKSFILNQDPAPGTITVKIAGAMAIEGSYSLSGRTINFVEAPRSFAEIMVDYRQNTGLLSRFKPNSKPVATSIKVLVNGVAAADVALDASTGEVVLPTLPSDGQSVEIAYLFNEGPRLSYTLPVAKDASSVKILEQTAAIGFVQNGNIFSFDAANHQAGKTLTLRYEIPDASTKTFELGQMPLSGTADIRSTMSNCALGMGLDILADKLISSCQASSRIDFTLDYKFREIARRFTVKGLDNPELGTWSVYLDGELVKDFIRDGATVILAKDPSLESRIEIHYTLPE